MIKKIVLLLCVIFIDEKITGQVYINDDFSTWSQGWTFYQTPCISANYSGVQDGTTGTAAPSAFINKSNCLASCSGGSVELGFSKTIAIAPAAIAFTFSVNYRAASNTTISVVTNARFKIFDNTNGVWITPGVSLIGGGTTDSGWQFYTGNFTSTGTSSLTVYLYSIDSWPATPWCRQTWFDNPFLSVTNALPIDLLDFKTSCNDDNTRLFEWSTASEINNNYFTVEGCSDGINWTSLAQINGAGNSSQTLHYSTTIALNSNYNYFRLKQTDFDGQSKYSDIIYSNCESKITQGVNIVSNSSSGEIILLLDGFENEPIEIEFTDVLGRLITKRSVQFTESNHEEIFIMPDDAAGIYFISILTPTQVVTKKMIREL